MNLAIYGLGDQRRRTWLVVDVGVSFASEENLPGIDLIFPDIRYLVEERRNIAGIVLTHAHEDHYGAMLDLWPKLKVPVYATPFTAALLEAKRQGEYGVPEIPVTEDCARLALQRRAVRHRARIGRPFDPGIQRAHSADAARQRAAHRRLEARSDAGAGPADRRGEVARARRRRLPRADRRFHQCRARRAIAVGIRRRQDPDRADREGAAARGGDDLRLQRRAHQGRRRCGAASRTRDRRGRPRHGPRHRGRARDRLSRRRAAVSRHGRLWPPAAGQGGGALHRQPGRAARGARPHRPGRASRGGAVEGRPRDLLVAPHSRQREGDRPHHQRADRPGRRGHHRPHASGACVRPSAPGRAGGHDRLGQAAHRHSGARRVAASVRTCGAGAAARRAHADDPQRRSRQARAGRSRDHRRGAGRAHLQGRLAADPGGIAHRCGPQAPEFFRRRSASRWRSTTRASSWPIPRSS